MFRTWVTLTVFAASLLSAWARPPRIVSTIPERPVPGQQMVIRGQGFQQRLERNSVRLGQVELPVLGANRRELLVSIPGEALSGDLRVTSGNETSTAYPLSLREAHALLQAPEELSAAPPPARRPAGAPADV